MFANTTELCGDPDFRISFRLDTADEPRLDLWLHGFVGDPETQTDSRSVSQLLAENPGAEVTLHVNSSGGLAYDGISIFNSLAHHASATTAIVPGLAGSAASIAVLGCDRRVGQSASIFHPHYSVVICSGHQKTLREALAVQERLGEDLEEIYVQASGRSLQQVQADLSGDNGDGTRFSASQAVAAGYLDEVVSLPQKTHRGLPSAALEPAATSAALGLRLRSLRRRVATLGSTSRQSKSRPSRG